MSIRVGKISAFADGGKKARVYFADTKAVSGELMIINGCISPTWQNAYTVNVLCIFPDNGGGDGFIIGTY